MAVYDENILKNPFYLALEKHRPDLSSRVAELHGIVSAHVHICHHWKCCSSSYIPSKSECGLRVDDWNDERIYLLDRISHVFVHVTVVSSHAVRKYVWTDSSMLCDVRRSDDNGSVCLKVILKFKTMLKWILLLKMIEWAVFQADKMNMWCKSLYDHRLFCCGYQLVSDFIWPAASCLWPDQFNLFSNQEIKIEVFLVRFTHFKWLTFKELIWLIITQFYS